MTYHHENTDEGTKKLRVTDQSHVDHGLTKTQLDYLCWFFGERTEFFIDTIFLPRRLGDVPCALYGPEMGDDPIKNSECFLAVRGNREGATRMTRKPLRTTSAVTVIAGPDGGVQRANEELVLYTAFGGPHAPMEPWDDDLPADREAESYEFWNEHALSHEILEEEEA